MGGREEAGGGGGRERAECADEQGAGEHEDDGLRQFARRRRALEVLDEQQVDAHGAGLDEAEEAEPDRQQDQVGERKLVHDASTSAQRF